MSDGKRKTETARRPAPRPTAAETRGPAVPLVLIEKFLGMSVAEARSRHDRLTERQRQVAELMAQGMTNRRIADEMGISPKTLDIHRADVFDKLECKTSAAVAAIVYLVNLANAVAPEG